VVDDDGLLVLLLNLINRRDDDDDDDDLMDLMELMGIELKRIYLSCLLLPPLSPLIQLPMSSSQPKNLMINPILPLLLCLPRSTHIDVVCPRDQSCPRHL
jgi:hypothetical protein